MEAKTRKKIVSETELFRSLIIFIEYIVPVIINTDKDIKVTFGYSILNKLIWSITTLRKAYNNKDAIEKGKTVDELNDVICDVEIMLKIMFELKYVSEKQQSHISLSIGDILSQVNGWKKAINAVNNNNVK